MIKIRQPIRIGVADSHRKSFRIVAQEDYLEMKSEIEEVMTYFLVLITFSRTAFSSLSLSYLG